MLQCNKCGEPHSHIKCGENIYCHNCERDKIAKYYEENPVEPKPIFQEHYGDKNMNTNDYKMVFKCHNCKKEYQMEYFQLLMCQDFQLDNNPSPLKNVSLGKDIWDNFRIHLTENDIICKCGQSIKIMYNTDSDIYLMSQISLDRTEVWEEIIDYKSPSSEQENIKFNLDSEGKIIKESYKIDTIDQNVVTMSNPKDYPKMYILVKDTIPLGLAMNAVGHSALACYLKFKDDPIMEEWLNTSFRKVTCKVTEEEFERAKQRPEDHIVMTELTLDKAETAIAFKPAKEFHKFFNFLKLYKEN